jgi:hypothetical protein
MDTGGQTMKQFAIGDYVSANGTLGTVIYLGECANPMTFYGKQPAVTITREDGKGSYTCPAADTFPRQRSA